MTADHDRERLGTGPSGPAPRPSPPVTGCQDVSAVPPHALAPGSMAQHAVLIDVLRVLLASDSR